MNNKIESSIPPKTINVNGVDCELRIKSDTFAAEVFVESEWIAMVPGNEINERS